MLLIRATAESQALSGVVPPCLLSPLVQLPEIGAMIHMLQVREVGSGRFSPEP